MSNDEGLENTLTPEEAAEMDRCAEEFRKDPDSFIDFDELKARYEQEKLLLNSIRNDEDLEDTLTPEEAAEIDRRSAEYDADPDCAIPYEVYCAERDAGHNLTPEEAAQIELEVRPERGSSLEDLIKKYRKLAEWDREQDELEAKAQEQQG
jgi:hypothetical protein